MDRQFSEYLGSPLDKWAIEFRVHATQRMFSRRIDDKDVTQLLLKGTIIEEYQDDFPFPSVLVSGASKDNRPLHAVVGINAESFQLFLITIYVPDPEKWTENFTKRLIT